MPKSKLGESILLKAEKDALRLKEDARKRIIKEDKEILLQLKKEVDRFKQNKMKEMEQNIKEEYHRKVNALRKQMMLEKRKAISEVVEEALRHIPKLDEDAKEKIYKEMKKVIEEVLGKSYFLSASKNDEKIIKKVFKDAKISFDKNIEFGVIGSKGDVIVDLTLDGLREEIEEKIEESVL